MILTKRKKNRLMALAQKAAVDLVAYLILLCVCFLILYPMASSVAAMFMSKEDLLDSAVVFIPKYPSIEHITATVQAMDFWTVIRDTGLLSALIAVVQLFSCTMIGYGFARYRFPGKSILFALVVFTMLVPVQMLMPSYYVAFQQFDILHIVQALTGSPLRLLGTVWPMVILSVFGLGFKNGLYIYFIRQFFINLPKELEESSRIDGAGFLQTFFRVMLPNAKPILITVFLFAFSWQWTDQYLTNLFLPGQPFVSGALSALTKFGSGMVDPVVVQAMTKTGVILVMLPVLILYLFLQRYFIQGIERSGLVG